jgi:hypothetical protein
MSRASRTAEILAAAGLVPLQLEQERIRAGRDAARSAALASLLPSLIETGAGIAGRVAEADLAERKFAADVEARKARDAAAIEARKARDAVAAETERRRVETERRRVEAAAAKTAADTAKANAEARATNIASAAADTESLISRPGGVSQAELERVAVARGLPASDWRTVLSARDTAVDETAALAAKAREGEAAAKLAERKAAAPLGGSGSSAELQRLRLDEARAKARERELAGTPEAQSRRSTLESSTLRKEFITRPEVEKASASAAEYENLNALATNPASAGGDLALVFSFMKVMDPGTAVKQEEFAATARAQGAEGRIVTAIGNVVSGQILSPEQRLDLARQAKVFRDNNRRRAEVVAKVYGDLATSSGFRPVDVLGNWAAAPAPEAAAPPMRTKPIAEMTDDELAAYKAALKGRNQ